MPCTRAAFILLLLLCCFAHCSAQNSGTTRSSCDPPPIGRPRISDECCISPETKRIRLRIVEKPSHNNSPEQSVWMPLQNRIHGNILQHVRGYCNQSIADRLNIRQQLSNRVPNLSALRLRSKRKFISELHSRSRVFGLQLQCIMHMQAKLFRGNV
ncbi:hypothetical protein BJ742DRAFT_530188 [Cladochytrium replicatum]|nr:hypothetical protein BJ742DRAFT_530188 [Cladochytrium replicatum]